MESLLTNFSETHRIISYLIIALAILIEGEVVLILAGILSHKGHLDIFNVILFAFAAAVIHDLIYWSIGKKLSASGKKKFLFINLEKIKGFLEKTKINNGLYVFISKFTWNLNRIMLITNGYLKMPIKELLRYSIPACLIWSITFVSIGYVFAFETDVLKKDIKTAALLLMSFIIIIVILENILRKIVEKKNK
ncbi:MAG: VTT domain-containing protein [bacterium]|nr:VTT domain-containing protein [bacterium]